MESRGQGCQSKCLFIYEFVEEVQDAAAAWEEGDKQDGACGREQLLDWMRSVGLAAAQSLR